jgi:site-specific DNA-methyltransferase (adenine-specific)
MGNEKCYNALEMRANVREQFMDHTPALPVDSILCGDCYPILQGFPSESVNLVITSPPYFQQRDYGGGLGNETHLQDYLENLLLILGECLRIIKPDGSIVFNLGDKYQESSLLLVPYRFAIQATERLPLKLVNAITWVKMNPTPRQFRRRLVSSTEPFFHFVKSENYFYNLDAFLAEERESKKPKNGASDQLGKSYFDLIAKSELFPEQKQQARDALYEVIQEVKSGKIEGFRMKIRGIHAEPFGGQAGGRQIQLEKNGFTIIRILGNPIKRDVIQMPVESLKNSNHPAIYPAKLVMELVHLLTREGDIVLDPFMGAGSTGVACKLTQRHYIGIDLNPDYCTFAQERIDNTPLSDPRLF